ncbi:hypothetical protein PPACK8108_LOCUS3190, partial [Phakopsora pachyrhizi]
MTPITISMIFRIENSVCSGNQRATRSVQIAKPAYNANVVAPRAKEWDMSDDMVLRFHNQHWSSNL